MIKQTLALIGLTLSLSANAASYEYRADSFSLNGVVVEEFNSSLNTFETWQGGTVTYQNGYAVFTDPGVIVPIEGSSFSYEYSGIAYQSAEFGGSEFTAQSTWSSDYLAEPPGGFFGQYLWDFGIEKAITVSMTNHSQEVADEYEGGVVGLAIVMATVPNFGLPTEVQTVSINPEDITGDIIFELYFDSLQNEITGAYSLDGGVSFVSPFQSYASSGNGRHVLYGDPIGQVPIPPAAWLFGSALLGLAVIKHRKS